MLLNGCCTVHLAPHKPKSVDAFSWSYIQKQETSKKILGNDTSCRHACIKKIIIGICILWCSTWRTAHRIIIDDDHDDDTWFCLLLKHCTAQLRSSLIKVWKRETCHFLCIPQFPSGLNVQLFVCFHGLNFSLLYSHSFHGTNFLSSEKWRNGPLFWHWHSRLSTQQSCRKIHYDTPPAAKMAEKQLISTINKTFRKTNN